MKVLKFVSAVIGLLFMTAQFTYGQTSSSATTTDATPVEVEANKTLNVKVKGVGCSRDVKEINLSVARLQGVSHCKTLKKGATTTFEVTFNPSITSEKDIYAAVEGTAGCSKQKSFPYKVKL